MEGTVLQQTRPDGQGCAKFQEGVVDIFRECSHFSGIIESG